MNKNDRFAFQAILAPVGELYGKPFSKALYGLYFDLLSHLSINDISMALKSHMSDSKAGKFIPKPADILHQLNKHILTPADKAEIGWASIIGSLSERGTYGHRYAAIKPTDVQVLAALEGVGGWDKICSTDEKQESFVKRDFVALYISYEKCNSSSLPDTIPMVEDLRRYKENGRRLSVT